MSIGKGARMTVMSIEECQKLDKPLRQDLEVLDYEVRCLVARIRSEAREAGADDAVFVKASTTVLLSIAAGLLARAAEDHRAPSMRIPSPRAPIAPQYGPRNAASAISSAARRSQL